MLASDLGTGGLALPRVRAAGASTWAAMALLALLFSLPIVFPVHRAPLPVFEVEVIAGVLLALLALVLGVSARRRAPIHWPLPVWTLGLVALVAVQQVLGLLTYSSQLTLACLYAFGLLGAYWVGRQFVALELHERATRAIALALVAGGCVSVVVQVLQVLDVRGLPWWLYFEVVDPFLRTRPFGNLGQANLLSTYLVWAMLAVLLLHRRGLRSGVAIGLMLLFAVGVALTRSRLGILFCFAVLAAVWVPCALRPLQRRVRIGLSLALVVGHVATSVLVALFVVHDGAAVDSALGRFNEQGGFAIRLVMWADALRIAATSPWIGVGFGDYAQSHYWLAHDVPHMQSTTYVHNLLLQTAAELGWPMALGLAALGAWWASAGLRERLSNPDTAFLWSMLVLMGVHSLLEWPLASLHFLIPTALMFALAEPSAATGAPVRIESRLLAVAGVAGILLAVPMWLEYDELSDVMLHAEIERRSESGLKDETAHRLLALSEASRLRYYPERLLVFLRGPASVEPTPEEIARHERLLVQGAEPNLVARLVLLHARAGQFDAALRHAERLKVFHRGDFEELAKIIGKGLEEVGAGADPLRTLLTSHSHTLQREGLDWRIKWRKDLLQGLPPSAGRASRPG